MVRPGWGAHLYIREPHHIQGDKRSGKLWKTKSPASKKVGQSIFTLEGSCKRRTTRAEDAFIASEVARKWQM